MLGCIARGFILLFINFFTNPICPDVRKHLEYMQKPILNTQNICHYQNIEFKFPHWAVLVIQHANIDVTNLINFVINRKFIL
jgi:hypothetical protein